MNFVTTFINILKFLHTAKKMAGKTETDVASTDSNTIFDENEIALKGMMMLVNNRYEEAQDLFYKHRFAYILSPQLIKVIFIMFMSV